jgi:hypothetical protein
MSAIFWAVWMVTYATYWATGLVAVYRWRRGRAADAEHVLRLALVAGAASPLAWLSAVVLT